MSDTLTIFLKPKAKPRMTKSDKWNKRKVVMEYWKFKDELKKIAEQEKFKLSNAYYIDFTIKMPRYWSRQKKFTNIGRPHQSKPDLDNLVKAINDCLKEDSDSSIYKIYASKHWGDINRITIENF